MAKVTVRVKYEGGQGVVRGLDPEDSLEKLISHSLESLGLPDTNTDAIRMLTGFPPKAVDLTNRDVSIDSLGIKSGDTLIYQLGAVQSNQEQTVSHPAPALPQNQKKTPHDADAKEDDSSKRQRTVKTPGDKELLRQVVPADNSCLFTSINFCMSGELVSSEHSSFMREIIAATVASDTDKYSEAILGRSNASYCEWILSKDAWGGAIEVQILAEYFQIEMVVVDIKSGSMTRFGECCGFPQRMVLLYDGIHYDPLYLPAQPEHRTLFPVDDLSILERARVVADVARAAHQHTDTANFTLRCLVCGHRMTGQTEAQAHAKQTGHINFSEIS